MSRYTHEEMDAYLNHLKAGEDWAVKDTPELREYLASTSAFLMWRATRRWKQALRDFAHACRVILPFVPEKELADESDETTSLS